MGRKFLGFSFTWHREPKKRIAPKALRHYQERVRELRRRTRGVSVEKVADELGRYLRGWKGHFGLGREDVFGCFYGNSGNAGR